MAELRIKPIIVLPKGEVTKRDIKKLNDNGLCVVEASDPSKVRFIDPPPEGYSVQERAAIELFRVLVAKPGFSINRSGLTEMYVEVLMRGWIPERVQQVARVVK